MSYVFEFFSDEVLKETFIYKKTESIKLPAKLCYFPIINKSEMALGLTRSFQWFPV